MGAQEGLEAVYLWGDVSLCIFSCVQEQLWFPELEGAEVQVPMSVGPANPVRKPGRVHCSRQSGTGKPTTFLELKCK